MVVGFLISLPEGLGAFLITAVLAAYCHHTGQKRAKAGLLAATVLAVMATVLLTATDLISVDGLVLQWLELATAGLGLALITWLAFRLGWADLPEVRPFTGVGLAAVSLLTFSVVLRELAEVAVFAAELSGSAGGFEILPGLGLGLALGAALAGASYRLLRSIGAGAFQIVASVALVFAAAAFGSQIATDLGTAGLLPQLLAKVVWDVNWIVPQNTLLGRFLHAFTGYDATPNFPAVVFYLSYLTVVGAFLCLVRLQAAGLATGGPAQSAGAADNI